MDSIRKVEALKYRDKVDMPTFTESILLSMVFGLGFSKIRWKVSVIPCLPKASTRASPRTQTGVSVILSNHPIADPRENYYHFLLLVTSILAVGLDEDIGRSEERATNRNTMSQNPESFR